MTFTLNIKTAEDFEAEEYARRPELVNAERDRRIDGQFTFNGKAYQSRPEDRENMAGAATSALAAIMKGAEPGDLRWHGGESDFTWISADNTLVPMDAPTMFALGQAAMEHKQRHIFAARALKDGDTIPADFADDKYWNLNSQKTSEKLTMAELSLREGN